MRVEGIASPPATPGAAKEQRSARPALSGFLAGLIGIGCCVYPAVLVLLGLSTAAAALDLANRLFVEWGWAFKLVGAGFAVLAIAVQRRRAMACPVDTRPSMRRTVLVVVLTGVLTYVCVYGITTWLGRVAT